MWFRVAEHLLSMPNTMDLIPSSMKRIKWERRKSGREDEGRREREGGEKNERRKRRERRKKEERERIERQRCGVDSL